jgi:DNA-directed RNA polymerase sigma subunit (sigma70/sigma32)
MQLTKQTLKQLIAAAYDEAIENLTAEEPTILLAEPVFDEDPPQLEEVAMNQSSINRLAALIGKLQPEERTRLMARFGYFTSQYLLNQLSKIKQAEKGMI